MSTNDSAIITYPGQQSPLGKSSARPGQKTYSALTDPRPCVNVTAWTATWQSASRIHSMAKAKTPNFEEALDELEALVERMEQGETSLEDSLKDFQRGIELTRTCQKALSEAEQKVEILLQKDSEPVEFEADTD